MASSVTPTSPAARPIATVPCSPNRNGKTGINAPEAKQQKLDSPAVSPLPTASWGSSLVPPEPPCSQNSLESAGSRTNPTAMVEMNVDPAMTVADRHSPDPIHLSRPNLPKKRNIGGRRHFEFPDAWPTSKQRNPGDVRHLLPGAAPGKPFRSSTHRSGTCSGHGGVGQWF